MLSNSAPSLDQFSTEFSKENLECFFLFFVYVFFIPLVSKLYSGKSIIFKE
jgi:hypothetical protein